jgi:hypothetical protein
MKQLLVAALAAFALAAQTNTPAAKPESKTEVAKVTPAPKPATVPELIFDELQTTKLQLIGTQAALVNKKYNITDYRKEIQPLAVQQQAIYFAKCKELGIPENLIATECGLETGIDEDGKVKLDATGKAIPARVWWQRSAPPAGVPTSGSGTK